MTNLNQEAERIQLRSEEIQEILGKPASWTARWGTLVIFFILLLLLGLSFVIKYPDKIYGEFKSRSSSAPIDVKATIEGQVSDLLVKPNQKIKKGDVLLVIQSNTKYKDILSLESILTPFEEMNTESLLLNEPPQGLQLGSLNNQYSKLLASYTKLKTENSAHFDKYRINSIFSNKKRINARIDEINREIVIEKKEKMNLEYRFQILLKNYKAGTSTPKLKYADLENPKKKISNQVDKLLSLSNELNELRQQKRNLITKSAEITIEQRDKGKVSLDDLRYNAHKLLGDIEIWKNNYVIKSPASGHVLFYPNIKISQHFFNTNDKILAIKPRKKSKKKKANRGHILVSKEDYEKIEADQPILISFPSHPSIKYGKVIGRIDKKTDLLENDKYIISTRIPNPPKTTTGNTVTFQNEMNGQAEIITKERSLFDRFFHDIL